MFRKISLLILGVFLLSGCVLPVTHGVVPSALFSSFKGPIDVAPSQERLGSKIGEACAMNILGLVSIGDASLETAARNGGIQRINTMSYSFMNALFILYSRYCLIVTGD